MNLDTEEGRKEIDWALDVWDEPNVARSMIAAPLADCGPSYTELDREALVVCGDPAKLTEMLVSEARRCGLTVLDFNGRSSWPFVSIVVVEPRGILLEMVHYPQPTQGIRRRCGLPEARAILAALLQLPDGACEQAQTVLRGEP